MRNKVPNDLNGACYARRKVPQLSINCSVCRSPDDKRFFPNPFVERVLKKLPNGGGVQ